MSFEEVWMCKSIFHSAGSDDIAQLVKMVARRSDRPAVSGKDIGLPLAETLDAVHSLSALRITWHSHKQFELLFLLDGATSYEFSNGQTFELTGGQFLVVPPDARHRGSQDVRMPATLCGIMCNPRRSDSQRHTPFTSEDLAWIGREFESRAPAVGGMDADLRRLVATLTRHIHSFKKQPAHSLTVASLRLTACAVILEAARQLACGQLPNAKPAMDAAMAHLEQSFSEAIAVEQLVQKVGCSRARFFQLFKQRTGMTPNDYLQRLRVNKAREMLRDSKQTVTEIAYATGFSSSQYFSNVFRKYSGMTPSDYRLKPGAR